MHFKNLCKNNIYEKFSNKSILLIHRQTSPNSATANSSNLQDVTEQQTLQSQQSQQQQSQGQSIGLYPVSQQQSQTTESNSTTPTTSTGTASTVPCTGSTPNIARSVSAPTGPRIQSTASSGINVAGTSGTGQRPRLRRNQSRTEAIKK